jgi:hypothetical protein
MTSLPRHGRSNLSNPDDGAPFRGIVFVSERRTAVRLCQLLRDHPALANAGMRPEVCSRNKARCFNYYELNAWHA